MLNKEEILENIKDASCETMLKVVDKLIELCNLRDEIIEDQKTMISHLERQNALLKKLIDRKDKEAK